MTVYLCYGTFSSECSTMMITLILTANIEDLVNRKLMTSLRIIMAHVKFGFA